MNDTSILRTEGLTIGYHENGMVDTISSNINIRLEKGKLTCLIGANGAGKSTLIRTLIGLQKPLEGKIWLNNTPLQAIPPRELSRSISIVLTEQPEAGIMTAYELVSLGRHPFTNWLGALSAQDHVIIENSLNLTKATALRDRQVHTLSDGERQKVMIARALAQNPDLMVLDEPTAFLDFPHRVEILKMLQELVLHHSCAVLLSTHDLDLALSTSDNILLIDENGILRSGAPEDLILNGSFEAAFNHKHQLVFDPFDASFHFRRKDGQVFSLTCEDKLTHHWTQRALERIGCSVTEKMDFPLIRVHKENNSTAWQFIESTQTKITFLTIHSLISYLQDKFLPQS